MLDSYNLIRYDQPSNTKKGGVCIYHKEPLAACSVENSCLLNMLQKTTYDSQGLLCEVTIQNKK